MDRSLLVARQLADALLAGPAGYEGFMERAAFCLGRRHRWLAAFCRRAFRHFGSALGPRDHRKLVEWIREDEGYRAAWLATRKPRIAHYALEPTRMQPRRGALAACALPALDTPADLAAWLGVGIADLDWLADTRRMNPGEGRLAHYRYSWVQKRFGARLVEAPKARLRDVQRRILRGILDPVPVHRGAHGFRKGRSCMTFVAPHVGRDVVLKLDLRNFFPGIPAGRVHALFETLGYPEAVARLLTGLCTNAVPMSIARRGAGSWQEAKRLGIAHLPQGAPTSPALANLCALHLDLRLDALAATLDARYTRYADDLAVSGGETLRRRVPAVARLAAAIAMEEGFELNHRKTRAMHRSRRQLLAGIVVNATPNVRRAEFDRLKAILTNCGRHGVETQNREGHRDFRAHLAGRVAYVGSLNPARGAKLEKLFAAIAWNTP